MLAGAYFVICLNLVCMPASPPFLISRQPGPRAASGGSVPSLNPSSPALSRAGKGPETRSAPATSVRPCRKRHRRVHGSIKRQAAAKGVARLGRAAMIARLRRVRPLCWHSRRERKRDSLGSRIHFNGKTKWLASAIVILRAIAKVPPNEPRMMQSRVYGPNTPHFSHLALVRET